MMPDFLVEMDIVFPIEVTGDEIRFLLAAESRAIQVYVTLGEFQRVWRTYGEHTGNHGHLALWSAPSRTYIRDAYADFPLVKAGYGIVWLIRELQSNPNDPGKGK